MLRKTPKANAVDIYASVSTLLHGIEEDTVGIKL